MFLLKYFLYFFYHFNDASKTMRHQRNGKKESISSWASFYLDWSISGCWKRFIPINFNQLFNFVVFPTQISQNFYRAAKSFKLCVLRKKKWNILEIEDRWETSKTARVLVMTGFVFKGSVPVSQFLSMPLNNFNCREKLKFQGNSIWNVSVFSITTIHSILDTINIIKVFFSLNFM